MISIVHYKYLKLLEEKKEKKCDDESDQNRTKLKASDIYSDDSNSSDSDTDESVKQNQKFLDSDSDTK